jgi:hypothetical protein
MGIARPAGKYAEQMISPGGWPEVDEATLSARAEEFAGVSRQLGVVLDSSAQQKMRVFEGGIWSGTAADAANDALGRNIDQLTALKSDADDATRWHNQIAGVIAEAKSAISDNVEAANASIRALGESLRQFMMDHFLVGQKWVDAVTEHDAAVVRVIATTYQANTGLVATTAEQILATGAEKTSAASPTESLDRTAPSADQNTSDQNTTDENTSGESTSDTENSTPAESQSSSATESTSGALSSLMSSASSGSSPTSPTASIDTVDQSTSNLANGASVVSPGSSSRTATPGRAGGVGKGLSAAALSSSPVGAAPVASAPMMAPRSAEDPSAAAPMGAPMGAGAAGGAAAGSRKGSAAPAGTSAASSPPGQKAPAGAGAQKGRQQEPDMPDRPAAAAAAAPPIPVSAARAERDAIAAATAPEAAKRGGADPLALARRVAAALNAADSDGADAFGFFWMTAVSTDGAIVVANSYGLAFIPAGVQLPEPVQLVTADADIPAVERARWVTYPAMAVQGWAAHHSKKLRAVIATAEQFGRSDPGAAKVVLEPEDIPTTGVMTGRSRLEVVDPDSAAVLAETTDDGLLDLLPPAPADSGALSDQRQPLWWEVLRPLTGSAEGRKALHLKAFGPYAALERDIALAAAHTAAETDARRAAVADWLYWRHVGELLHSAVGGAQ